MLEINNALKNHADDARLRAVAARGRKMFMTHQLDSPGVTVLIHDAELALGDLDEAKAAGVCTTLASQLPEDDASLSPAQLQDNIYGRVFDSKMVAALVDQPPVRMLDGAGKAGVAFAAMLPDDSRSQMAARRLRDKYLGEVRSWTAAVPELNSIKNATDEGVLGALKDFLKAAPTTGKGIIARSFVMTKMAICQKYVNAAPQYMDTADRNYMSVIMPQANRDRITRPNVHVLSEGAGITLLHQPTAVASDSAELTERPATANRFNQRNLPGILEKGLGLEEQERSPATVVQHEHALPFASGVSGSTNIMLHMYKAMKNEGMDGVGSREFLMNAMLFLVHDGGHSMHEVMWTANQLDATLGLELNLGDPSKPNEFVADYDKLVDGCEDDMRQAMKAAADKAWDDTQSYLEKNSYFAG
jgi:hypothetical protein